MRGSGAGPFQLSTLRVSRRQPAKVFFDDANAQQPTGRRADSAERALRVMSGEKQNENEERRLRAKITIRSREHGAAATRRSRACRGADVGSGPMRGRPGAGVEPSPFPASGNPVRLRKQTTAVAAVADVTSDPGASVAHAARVRLARFPSALTAGSEPGFSLRLVGPKESEDPPNKLKRLRSVTYLRIKCNA